MYTQVRKLNIINNNNYYHHNSYGPTILLEDLNLFMFGTKISPLKNPLWNYNSYNIFVKKDDSNYYIRIDKITKYFELIGDLSDQEENYILINYYKFNNWNIGTLNFNSKLNSFFTRFKSFISNIKTYDFYKNLEDKHLYKQILKFFNPMKDSEYNSYILSDIDQVFNTKIVKCKLIGDNYCNITFGFEDCNDVEYYINLNNFDKDDFIIISKYILDTVRKLTPDNFIISNLTSVTKSASFSRLLFQSYKNDTDHTIPIDLIANNTINWRNTSKKIDYLIFFKETYPNLINSENNINFEGFNKFYLNLEKDSLKNFNEKDRVNDFYTNITKELISSYKELFDDLR